jgi:hypothetical protein
LCTGNSKCQASSTPPSHDAIVSRRIVAEPYL